MASASNSGKQQRGSAVWRGIRYGLIGIAVTGVLAGAIYGAQRVEQFLIADTRFTLPGPTEYGEESANVHLSGVKWASRAEILRVFQRDYNRSLYLLPLAERRNALLRVNWVRNAFITRIWPNELAVHVDERQPVAFLQIPFGPMSRYALIDGDGVVLEPPARARFDLPVITGVKPSAPIADRATRVHRMQRLTNELGSLASGISEIDVSDLDNLRIREQIQNQTVLLDIGDRNFASRMRTFVDQFPNIRARLPVSAELDLRIDDQIIAVSQNAEGRN
ncbi:MAG TPA: FtsQ-type POTRA domain-containing protein [Bryobacteraceae bacterium]|nr:FtsQ-type POTRA domain-containing protein [Bryobacteraceae bacterium]